MKGMKFGIVRFSGLQQALFFKSGPFDFIAEFSRNQRRGVVVDGLIDRYHDAIGHQFGDHFAGFDAHPFSQIGQHDRVIDTDPAFDGFGGRDLGFLRHGRRFDLGAFATLAWLGPV